MMSCNMIRVCFIFIAFNLVHSQEYIGFPENVEDKGLLPTDGRTALSLAKLCKENEALFPGDEPDSWICDCKRGYVYNAELENCYPLYEQGFCPTGKYVAFAEDGFTPVCKLNICMFAGKVPYNRKCVRLGEPCDVDTRRLYGVNETTLAIECLQPYIVYVRSGFEEVNQTTTTRIGTRRARKNRKYNV